MTKEINTRNYILTCWVKDITNENFYDFYLNSILNEKINKIIIGGVERTENDLEHYHVFLKFKNPIRLNTLKKILNVSSIHIEKANGTLKQCYEYCTKESCYFTNVAETELIESIDKDDIYQRLIDDIFINNFKLVEIVKKYGKIAILHIGNLEKIYQVKQKADLEDFSNKIFDDTFNFVE